MDDKILLFDNAPIHNCVETRNWLSDNDINAIEFGGGKNGVLGGYPPYSPDLDPCEICIGLVKRFYYKQLDHWYQDEKQQETTEKEMKKNKKRINKIWIMQHCLCEAWEKVKLKSIQNIMYRWPKVLREVIKVNGAYGNTGKHFCVRNHNN